MAMGWKYLDAKLKAEEIDESIREIIHGMAGGNAAHQTDALNFGLYDALRQKGSADHSFARLRCPYAPCEARRQPVSYLTLGDSISCTNHEIGGPECFIRQPQAMECSECGHA